MDATASIAHDDAAVAGNAGLDNIVPHMLPLDRIVARYNPRRHFDAKKIEELAENIRQMGIIEPLVVRAAAEFDGCHALICGGRRLRAAQLALLTEVPVVFKDVDDTTAALMAMSENVHRESLSPAEEARGARDLLNEHGGDMALTARALTWPMTKLRSRLALLHCADVVLDAVDTGELNPLLAEILSTLPMPQQESALPGILAKGVTASALRDEVQKYAMPLSLAPFDTVASCQGCPHNSESQLTLFGITLDTARCSNAPCFATLSRKALEEKRTALEDEFATVALKTDRNADTMTVVQAHGPSGVGAVQLATGCKGCRFYGALIDDRLTKQIGTVTRGVCFDAKGCHAEKVATYQAALTPTPISDDDDDAATQPSSPARIASSPSSVARKASAAKPAPRRTAASSKAAPGSVVRYAESLHQRVAAKLAREDASAALAVLLVAARKLPVSNAGTNPLTKAASSPTAKQRLAKLASQPYDELLALAQAAVAHSLEADGVRVHDEFAPIPLARALLHTRAIDLAKHFKVDKDYLAANTVSGIEADLEASGFTKWYRANHEDGDKAYKKLLTGTKKTVIEAILAASFDWTGYLPGALRTKASH